MKKFFLVSSVCAAALLTACSNDEPINNGTEVSDGTPRYLSVNIVSNSGTGTRAAGDVTPGNPTEENALYEEGLSAENNVTRVRFYFFDANGAPAYVKAGKDVNYFDWTEEIGSPDSPNDVNMPNVEKILNATIVISTKEGDTFPSQMLCVVNPRSNLGDGVYSLEDIRKINADYATFANGGTITTNIEIPFTQDGKPFKVDGNWFPMCNSVYAQDGQRITATKITPENYKETAKDAKENPVQVFVERNVAKVRVALDYSADMIQENGMIKLQDKDKNPIVIDGHQVYLKLDGWNVTADMNTCFLSKRFPENLSDWTNEKLGFIWNNPEYHRSYWAFQSTSSKCRYGNFDAAKAKEFYNGKDKTKGFTYCNENTSAQGNTDYLKRNTKIILAGTLCYENEQPLTLCEYYGVKFVDDSKQTNLKKQVLNYLTDNGLNNYYRKVGNNTVVSISPDDITFVYAKNASSADSKGLYYVIPTLTDDALNYSWFTSDRLAPGSEADVTDIKDALEASQHAKIWNEGKTYYYADINHFGTDVVGGQKVARRGVVRNHIYDMSINTIYGLGTPVWNDKTNIIPEKTEDEDTYIGAQINILSWRIVNNKVNLEW